MLLMMPIADSVGSYYSPLATIGIPFLMSFGDNVPHRHAYPTPCYIALNL
jgi:hypothetical protein